MAIDFQMVLSRSSSKPARLELVGVAGYADTLSTMRQGWIDAHGGDLKAAWKTQLDMQITLLKAARRALDSTEGGHLSLTIVDRRPVHTCALPPRVRAHAADAIQEAAR